MSHPVHRSGAAAKSTSTAPIKPSPAQAALLAELRDERDRLSALALRAQRLGAVREGSDAHAVLSYLHVTIRNAFAAFDSIERLGGRIEYRYTSERGAELSWIGPPSQIIEIAPYLARRAGKAC